MSDIILDVNSLSANYGAKIILNDINLQLKKSDFLGVIGPSGSGKSTFIKALTLLDQSCKIDGKINYKFDDFSIDLLNSNQSKLLELRKFFVSYIFQDPLASFNPNRKIGSQIKEAYPGKTDNELNEIILERLGELRIENPKRIFNSYPHEISLGQLQRAALCMALIKEPKLIIADEPSSSLDSYNKKQILDILNHENSKGTSIILVSHDLDVISHSANRTVILENGNLNSKSEPLISKSNHFNRSEIFQKNEIIRYESVSLKYFSWSFLRGKKERLLALNDISFSLHKNEILGIIGESGSGKSSIAKILLQIESPSEGKVYYNQKVLSEFSEKDTFQYRKEIQMIFQNPDSSLDPLIKAGDALIETIIVNKKISRDKARKQALELFNKVKLEVELFNRLPFELSGGEKQRVCIARALAVEPEVLVCDEALSSLDNDIQIEILKLLYDLKKDLNLSIIFISHDLNQVSKFCDSILLLEKGQIIEYSSREAFINTPKNQITKDYLNSLLSPIKTAN